MNYTEEYLFLDHTLSNVYAEPSDERFASRFYIGEWSRTCYRTLDSNLGPSDSQGIALILGRVVKLTNKAVLNHYFNFLLLQRSV